MDWIWGGLPGTPAGRCSAVAGGWGWNAGDLAAYLHGTARHKGVIHLGYIADEHLPALIRGASAVVYLGAWEPAAFNIDRSFQLLFMVIIGGLGSIMGSFFGAAFIVMVPIILDNAPILFGIPIDTATASHLTFMIFGALIVFFLIVEPHGLARLWSIGKEKLRLWPFPH